VVLLDDRRLVWAAVLVGAALLGGDALLVGDAGGARGESVPARLCAEQLSENAYVDIATGFSLRGPRESLLSRSRGSCLGGAAVKLPKLANWPLLKVPPSKELVSFWQGQRGQYLQASLLTTREKLTIEQICRGREGLWLSWQGHLVEIVELQTAGVVKGLSAGRLKLSYRPEDDPCRVGTIREIIVQKSADRFFLLTTVSPEDDLGASGARGIEDDANTPTRAAERSLIECAAETLTLLGETEVQARWASACKRGQLALAGLSFSRVAEACSGRRWYRVRREGHDVGCAWVDEQAISELSQAGGPAIEVRMAVYINNAPDAMEFARGLGWGLSGLEKRQSFTGAVLLSVCWRLTENLQSERFTVRLTDVDDPDNGYKQQGVWQGKGKDIELQAWRDLREPQNVIRENLAVKDEMYLPGTWVMLLGAWARDLEDGELVFVRYSNGDVCHYSVHVSSAAGPAMDERAGQNGAGARLQPAKYVLTQSGNEGAICEMWLSKEGQVLRQAVNGILLELSTAEEIERLWPGNYELLKSESFSADK